MSSQVAGEGQAGWLRSWAAPILLGLAVFATFVLLDSWIPRSLRGPLYVGFLLIPFIVMWFASGATVLAVGAWLLPGLAIIGLAWIVAPGRIFLLTVGAVALCVWSATCTQTGWSVFGRYLAWIGDPVALSGLSPRERTAYRQLFRLMRPDRATLRAARQANDRSAMINTFRAPAERMLQIEAPDQEWADVIRLCAAPGLLSAEQLERQELDYDAVTWAAGARDRALRTLLRARSPMYRILAVQLRAPNAETTSAN